MKMKSWVTDWKDSCNFRERDALSTISTQGHVGWLFLNTISSFGWTVGDKMQPLCYFGKYSVLTLEDKLLGDASTLSCLTPYHLPRVPPVQDSAHLDESVAVSYLMLQCFKILVFSIHGDNKVTFPHFTYSIHSSTGVSIDIHIKKSQKFKFILERRTSFSSLQVCDS